MRDSIINLHVCSEDKFMPPFIDFVKENFPDASNVYFIKGRSKRSLYDPLTPQGENKVTRVQKIQELAIIIRLLYVSKRVVLHGFTNKYVIIFLAVNPWLHAKCYWSIWGGELYAFNKKKNLPRKVYDVFKSSVIRRVGHILTYIPGDVELARKWYGAKGKHIECLMYTSNVITDNVPEPEKDSIKKSEPLKVMVGNSAAISNRHLFVFERLKSMQGTGYTVLSPLSYGDKQYALEVCEKGKEIFGERFCAITEFMQYKEYLKLLNDVDVAIFAHERQQAMGNIIMLLALGKKVYMNKSSTLAGRLGDIGLVVFDVNELNLDPIGKEESVSNSRIIREKFNATVLKEQLRAICD